MMAVSIAMALALIEYMVLGFLVGRARGTYHVEAPAISGDPMFDRYFRVHQNTMEQLIIFVPAMLLFAFFVNPRAAALLGLLFVVARIVYARGYLEDPKKRSAGARLTFIVLAILVLGALFGAATT